MNETTLRGAAVMKMMIRFSKNEELKALPILLRYSSGMVLPGRTYVLCDQTVNALRQSGVRFEQLGTQSV